MMREEASNRRMSPPVRCRKGSRWNRNVLITLVFTFLTGAARGVWSFTTLSVYLKMLAGSTTAVGAAEGLQGIGMAVAAVISGVLADKYARRDCVLRFAGVLGLLSCCLFFFGLLSTDALLDSMQRYAVVTGALVVMGLFQGVSTTCVDTLFADSVQTGERSRLNTFRFAVTQVSSTVGPLICIVLFSQFGDEWSMDKVKEVFVIGIGLHIIPILLILFLSDDETRGWDSESHFIPSTPGPGGMRYQHLIDEEESQVEAGDGGFAESPFAPFRPRGTSPDLRARRVRSTSEGGTFDSAEEMTSNALVCDSNAETAGNNQNTLSPMTQSSLLHPTVLCFGRESIASIVVFSDLISALGSGMTVKFFPLFFKSSLGMTPIQVNSVYVLLPVFMTFISFAAARMAGKCGRVQMCVVLSTGSTFALFALAYYGKNASYNDASIVLPLYFLSTLQHSARPMRRAILMDWVPKRKRARFNSVDSVTRLNWSGSAFVGAISIDKYGYGQLFFYTAMLQLASIAIFALLLPLVPVNESVRIRGMSDADEEHRSNRSTTLEV